MTDNSLLRRLLIDEEGLKLKAYKDSEKQLWHIGIGHNLEIDQTDEELEVLGDYDQDDPSGLTITKEQAYALFNLDVEDAIEDVYPAFTHEDLDALTSARRAAILSMTFQMGGGGVRKFKNFIAAVKAGDFETAADEMLYANVETGRRSAWYRQTPERCQRAADAMRVGYFEKYQDSEINPRPNQVDTVLAGFTDQELIEELARRLGI